MPLKVAVKLVDETRTATKTNVMRSKHLRSFMATSTPLLDIVIRTISGFIDSS
jgi:hypothetical protein